VDGSAVPRDVIQVGEDRDAAEFILALKAPDAVERDNAKVVTRASVRFLRSLGDPENEVRVAEVRTTTRRTVEPNTLTCRVLVLNDSFFVGSLADGDARLIGFGGVTAVAAVRSPLRNQQARHSSTLRG